CDSWGVSGDAVHHRIARVVADDLTRARGLGLNSYRFSIEWGKVFRTKNGPPDARVLAVYEEQIVAMRARHLEPVVTLHHYALPRWISDPETGDVCRQGFRNPEILPLFEKFVRTVVARLAP